jgi:hypothetical protein
LTTLIDGISTLLSVNFEHALSIARQRTKSWEFRAAMSMARYCPREDRDFEIMPWLRPSTTARSISSIPAVEPLTRHRAVLPA